MPFGATQFATSGGNMSNLPSVPELDFIPENGQWIEPDKADEGLNVKFYKNPVTGEDHIEIRNPGDERTVHDTTATDYYKMRFRRAWDNYQAQLDNYAGQIRIETVSWIDPGTMTDMKRYGIHTLEQLSQMSDSSISQTNMIGLMSFREKALKHLADQQKSSEYDELKATNADLMKRLEALEQTNKKGPGRPRKAV